LNRLQEAIWFLTSGEFYRHIIKIGSNLGSCHL